MKRIIVEIEKFSNGVDDLIRKNKLLIADFENFKNHVAHYPDAGEIIPGTRGVRKIRLASASRGKSGGFRVYYYDHQIRCKIVLLLICAKNRIENISSTEKQILKTVVTKIKGITYE